MPHQYCKFIQYHARTASFRWALSCFFFIEVYVIFRSPSLFQHLNFFLLCCIESGAKLRFASVFIVCSPDILFYAKNCCSLILMVFWGVFGTYVHFTREQESKMKFWLNFSWNGLIRFFRKLARELVFVEKDISRAYWEYLAFHFSW